MASTEYALSVIIPTLNEATTLPGLIRALGEQQNIHLDVIVADGGSTDDTLVCCRDIAATMQLPFQGIDTLPGRAKQMNAGAQHARSEELLFLHADTTISDVTLLVNAQIHMQKTRIAKGHDDVAGHFGLRFVRTESDHAEGYYFFEAKTRLNRRDCINGDQGFCLSKGYLQRLGGFDESLGYMEDARLANKIFDHGHWETLPGSVGTSARRFEVEGLKPRQTLNALLCNFDRIGLHGFFDAAKTAYRQQGQTATLDLAPFLKIIHHLSFAEGVRKGVRYWLDTGRYVAGNAWQLAFQKDCRRNSQQGYPVGEGELKTLKYYDRYISPVITSWAGCFLATLLTLVWFYVRLISALFRLRS